ncbi:MAG: acyl-CoA thioesterase [Bacteroidetes bacterium]|nr:acyl-CoA thioesterase [Bacteroidota bacterium]
MTTLAPTKTPTSVYKIRFSDCDMFGHLNNSRYLDYLINAREDHLILQHQFDFNKYYKNDFGWVIGSHEIAYLRPAIYNEQVTVQSTLMHADKDVLHVEILMMNEHQNQLKAVLRTTFVPIHLKTGRREQHPDDLLDWATDLVNADISHQELFSERVKTLVSQFKELKK